MRSNIRTWLAPALATALLAAAAAPAAAQSNIYCGPADIAFVVENTTYTQSTINDLKATLTGVSSAILAQIEQSCDPQTGRDTDYRLALVTFTDHIQVRVNFSPGNRAEFESAVSQLNLEDAGVGDANASDEALRTVINTLAASDRLPGQQIGNFTEPFRGIIRGTVRVRKFIFLLTDSPPGGFDGSYNLGVDDVAAHQRALEALTQGIQILAIWSPTTVNGGRAIPIMEDYATTTNGFFTRTDEPSPPFPAGLTFPSTIILRYLSDPDPLFNSSCVPVNRPPFAGCYPWGDVAASSCTPVAVSIAGDPPYDSWDWEDGDIPPALAQTPPGPYEVGTTLVTLTATDSAGATDSCSVNVVVTCNQPPVLTVPDPITAEATGPAGASVTFSVTATDYAGNPLTPTCTHTSGATFPIATTTVQCSATANGQTTTKSFTVTVRDTTAPSVTLAAPPAGNVLGVVWLAATASDMVGVARVEFYLGGTLLGTDLLPSYNAMWNTRSVANGPYTLRARAYDASGNSADAVVNVTVANGPPVVVTSFTASVPLPAQLGTSITWTVTASGGTPPLHYQFWLRDEAANTWTMARDYAATSSFSWTPPAAGTYGLQVWVRSSDALATAYEGYASTGLFTITSGPPARVTSVTASVASAPAASAPYGTEVAWTATASGGSGTLTYEFWRYCYASPGWTLEQAYSTSNVYRWTPGATHIGTCIVQARVRSAALTSVPYESVLNSSGFRVTSANPIVISSFTMSAPAVAHGTNVRLTAVASGGSGDLNYQFWRYSYASGTWTMVQDYSILNTLDWTPGPADVGAYTFQVWVKNAGAPTFEISRGTGVLAVTASTPATITSLTASPNPPVVHGTPITWRAVASGGGGTLEFEFWRYCIANPQWILARAYEATDTWTWTPGPSDVGTCYVQARVRTQGTAVPYEGFLSSPGYMILSTTPVTISSFSATPRSPVPALTPVTFTAVASADGLALEYQFWRYSYATGTWVVVQAYSSANTYHWTPQAADAGTYAFQVWVRKAGAVAFEAARGIGFTVSP